MANHTLECYARVIKVKEGRSVFIWKYLQEIWLNAKSNVRKYVSCRLPFKLERKKKISMCIHICMKKI